MGLPFIMHTREPISRAVGCSNKCQSLKLGFGHASVLYNRTYEKGHTQKAGQSNQNFSRVITEFGRYFKSSCVHKMSPDLTSPLSSQTLSWSGAKTAGWFLGRGWMKDEGEGIWQERCNRITMVTASLHNLFVSTSNSLSFCLSPHVRLTPSSRARWVWRLDLIERCRWFTLWHPAHWRIGALLPDVSHKMNGDCSS